MGYWYIGENPTVDLVVLYKDYNDEYYILNIVRDSDVENNKIALPGGFVDTTAPKGGSFYLSYETFIEAAKRELLEETNFDINVYNFDIKEIGVFSGNNRDPRDNDISWSASRAFGVILDINEVEYNSLKERLSAQSDARYVGFMKLSDFLSSDNIAFDHKDIVKEFLLKYNIECNTNQKNKNKIM